MKKLPLKIKLTIVMATVIAAVISIVCFLNSFLLEKYYINDRKDKLISSYDSMKDTIERAGFTSDEMKQKMNEINALYNINVIIVDSNWQTAYSTQNNTKDAYRWLQRFIFSHDKDITLIEENNEYTIKKGNDIAMGLSYMVIYGTLEDGTQVVMQLILESIKENISIFNRFVQITGISVLLIGVVFVFFISDRFTKPVKKLSHIAEEMSNLNFDVKYTGHYKDEIGKLGESMNIMSDNLKANITMLKNANYELKKDIEQKNEISKRQREFLANVSHELKTPIALIQGYAEGLKEGVIDDKENLDFYCDVIMDEAIKMNKLVKNLLSLDHIESGKDNVNIERFNLSEMVNEIIRSNSLLTEQKGISVEKEISDVVFVWYDKLQIEEVFSNFFSNAMNHSNGKIKVILSKQENKVRLQVFNTGDKIPESDISRIWDKFYKVDKARTREYGGNGIGLSIVKAILDSYGVPYGVQNEENGVSFWLILDCD